MHPTAQRTLLVFCLVSLLGSGATSFAQTELRDGERLAAPETGRLTVGFVLSPAATVIDFAGPWEVFQDVMIPGRGPSHTDVHPFKLVTIAESTDPIRATGGLRIVPDFSFADAPDLNVIVIPAQSGSPGLLEWLKEASTKADITISVCTGAFLLARAGLLDGRAATTHHEFLDRFERTFPAVELRRNVRYVEGPRFATAGGLTSGIDLALRIVERYFGSEVAQRTATYMEHSGTGWKRGAGYWDASRTPGR